MAEDGNADWLRELVASKPQTEVVKPVVDIDEGHVSALNEALTKGLTLEEIMRVVQSANA